MKADQVSLKPGAMVRRYADNYGWPLSTNNILVEGESDVRYFQLAAVLYKERHGFDLLDSDLAIFPAGIGNEGGVDGILDRFHPFRKLIEIDTGPDLKPRFRAVALFDFDRAGKAGFEALAARYLHFRKWRDIFFLRHILPRRILEPTQLGKEVDSANQAWKSLDCEIEDLLSGDIIDAFLDENKGALRKKYVADRMAHIEFETGYKPRLLRFAEDYATLEDLKDVVDALISLRFYCRLPIA